MTRHRLEHNLRHLVVADVAGGLEVGGIHAASLLGDTAENTPAASAKMPAISHSGRQSEGAKTTTKEIRVKRERKGTV
jgi:hypothetical protein